MLKATYVCCKICFQTFIKKLEVLCFYFPQSIILYSLPYLYFIYEHVSSLTKKNQEQKNCSLLCSPRNLSGKMSKDYILS